MKVGSGQGGNTPLFISLPLEMIPICPAACQNRRNACIQPFEARKSKSEHPGVPFSFGPARGSHFSHFSHFRLFSPVCPLPGQALPASG